VVGSSSDSSGVAVPPPVLGSSSASSGGSLVIFTISSSSDAAVDGGNGTEVRSSSAKGKFFPGFIDHDPFAAGQSFDSEISTASAEDTWPSPISDESDDLFSQPSTQPTGGFMTPDILPPDPEAVTATGTGASSGLYWTPVETTTSSILDNEAVIGWRYKQKMRGSQRSRHSEQAMNPKAGADDEGNVFSLLQVAEQERDHDHSKAAVEAEDEFSAKHLAQEQTELLARLSAADKTKPGWL